MSFQQPQAKGRGLCVRHIFIDNKPCPFLLLCMSCTQPCSWRSSAHPQRCRQTTPSRQDSRSVFERLLPGKTFPGRSRSGTPEGTGVAVAGDRGQQCFTVVGGHGQELSRRTKAEVVNEDVSTRARPLAWGCWTDLSFQQPQAKSTRVQLEPVCSWPGAAGTICRSSNVRPRAEVCAARLH